MKSSHPWWQQEKLYIYCKTTPVGMEYRFKMWKSQWKYEKENTKVEES